MRGFVFTERERGLLRLWLDEGVESGETRKLFVLVRRNVPGLREDLGLLLEVAVELRRRGRWRGYVTGGTGFGSVFLAAGRGLTRVGRGRSSWRGWRG